jgi:hypothetical protein
MHLKKWFLGLCLIVLVVGEIFLFSANQQKSAALVALRVAKQAAEQSRADLEQLKIFNATQSSDDARLRAENQSLSQKIAQLQNDNSRLQKANRQLSQQLQSTAASAQQQQEQLQQIAAENQARAEQQQSEADAERNQCINNLRQIDAAKQEWALEKGKTADYVPTEQDIVEIAAYIKGGMPVCPSGGIYTIGAIGEPPSCSIHGVFQP